MQEFIQRHAAIAHDIVIANPAGFRAAILEKSHLAQFLSDALQESGLVTSAYEDATELLLEMPEFRPHLVVLGTLKHGIDSVRVIEELSQTGYGGLVLVVGPEAAPLTKAVQNLGTELGLRMLPFLATPFGQDALRSAVEAAETVSAGAKTSVDLREALRAEWLELWYQPKLELRSFTLQGAEALLRLRHPVDGFIGPDRIIPHASRQDLLDVSTFVITRAFADWQWFVDNHGPLEIAINLPLAYLRDPDCIADFICRIPAHPAFDGLIVETDASELVRDLDTVKGTARTLSPRRVALSVDDLDAEWPEILDIAHDFPFAEIKVDRSLVANCCDDSRKRSACRRIVEFADAVGARTVAEGVQTRAEFIAVRELGFDAVQGYFVAKPMPRGRFLSRVLHQPMTLAGMYA